ncbi:MAG: type I restriction enzyme HsdR N-terminal domain-containing protein [Prevotella sp.]|nr:type I restriction enzyme HsdR N-terminal domain-containing protein [Prevotella sp.]
MNKKFWELYKGDPAKQKVIEMFNPRDVEDQFLNCQKIIDYAVNWKGEPLEKSFNLTYDLLDCNLIFSDLLPKEDESWTREKYARLVEEYELRDYEQDEEGNVRFYYDDKAVFLPPKEYRAKASFMQSLSLWLYYHYDFFKPMLLPHRFDIIQQNCDTLGIEIPPIPNSKDYRAYLMYYYDICEVWDRFQKENGLSDEEFCACLYDFATMYREEPSDDELPTPTNVWLTGASGKGDFGLLDKADNIKEHFWACNERTKRGDIVIIYCTSPRSYIHSIWRAKSGGIFNPFDYYHCRTTVCDGIIIPPISFNDLKADEYFSQVPIVRRNLQGVNGIDLTAKDYAELQRMIKEKGGNIEGLPKLFDANGLEFEEIGDGKEKDVEEKILIPALKMLGYDETDWVRQLKLKKGRTESEIPDFVFFPHGDKHFETAPFIIEAKLDMSSVLERRRAFSQCRSYAQSLHASLMGICDKEELIIYEISKDGSWNYTNPIFEKKWKAIFGDNTIGADLKKIIGKENIKAKLM